MSPRIARVASEPVPAIADEPRTSAQTNQPEAIDPLVAQLGQLASQHHASDYNRMKFGSKGSPLVYVPYSVQMPDHYKEMQAYQLRCSERQAWWHSENRPSQPDLCEELSAAISAPLVIPQPPQAGWQTSETHPIVISTVIPSELLPIISSYLERCTDDYPTIFRLPRSHLLDRAMPRRVEPPAPIPVPAPVSSPSHAQCPQPPRTSSSHSITKSLKLPTFFWVHPSVRRAFLGDAPALRPSIVKRPRPASFGASSAVQYPALPLEYKRPSVARNISSPNIFKTKKKELETSVSSTILQQVDLAVPRPHPARLPNAALVHPPGIAIPEVPRIPPIGTAKLIGNLYLSSCPGKKVRLDGPVRGRGTVCRDLRSDLERIKNVGTACLVCLLDDHELQALGVTWEDYVLVAAELGMDVLRLPIPEGLPPNDPATLDAHLTKLIERYTLRGSAILVHCRGGVGRAGIIACCWMLKLGLCGWLDANVDASLHQAKDDQIDAETMHLVERLISVVRRRRSPKAIETYEQVRFLVEYVTFLREQRESNQKSEAQDWFADWETRVE
ncbi:phosphatases II [Trametes versicolor FP-101664 SS1]|uniref:phosphatases II n=1 Tax=Trametes versicolor (strain FP-101664) TaxID=717944 RepID=UPI0004622AE3|nr:phosphatases II [Trametes versicolor FP-101664 SS1]EIW63131.1 phosphatases II [Trametes versicolor FP-101664 SS1]